MNAPSINLVGIQKQDSYLAGSDIHLKCFQDSFPTADRYIWFNDDVSVYRSTSPDLYLHNMEYSKSGDYRCMTANAYYTNTSKSMEVSIWGMFPLYIYPN